MTKYVNVFSIIYSKLINHFPILFSNLSIVYVYKEEINGLPLELVNRQLI